MDQALYYYQNKNVQSHFTCAPGFVLVYSPDWKLKLCIEKCLEI